MFKTILLFTLISIGISCKKEKLEEHIGIIKDYTGMLDGCGMLIELDNGNRLEPVKNTSGITFENNRRVVVKFKDKAVASICMAGQTVEIISLRYL